MGKRVRAGGYDFADPTPERSPVALAVWLLVLALVAAALWWLWRTPEGLARIVQSVQQSIGMHSASQPPHEWPDAQTIRPEDTTQGLISHQPLPVQEPAEPLHPLEQQGGTAQASLPYLDASDPVVMGMMATMSNPQAVNALLRNDQFIRRIVATVDNLPSSHASTSMWPIHPVNPQFTTEQAGSASDTYISPQNSQRYAAVLALATQLDMTVLADQYRHLYPLFQQAYEELGYPNRYFNDRLIEVIDLLLKTPEPVAPRVRIMTIRGEVPTEQPWVHYAFEDPQLEALSAGQKMLLRMGPDNARAIKQQLRAFRAAITAPGAAP